MDDIPLCHIMACINVYSFSQCWVKQYYYTKADGNVLLLIKDIVVFDPVLFNGDCRAVTK